MAVDPDNVRVDLLKFRRKAYLSYPEGSPERKKFLKIILQNELYLSQQDMPHDVVNYLLEGKQDVFWSMFKDSLLWVLGLILSLCIFILSVKHWWSVGYLFLGGFFLFMISEQIVSYISYRKHINVLENYSKDMKLYVNKLSSDIKKLDGPHGM